MHKLLPPQININMIVMISRFLIFRILNLKNIILITILLLYYCDFFNIHFVRGGGSFEVHIQLMDRGLEYSDLKHNNYLS